MSISTPPSFDQSHVTSPETSQRTFRQWLIEPATSIHKPETRRQVRLLSTVLIILIPQMAIGVALTWHFIGISAISGTLALATGGLILAYILSRTRYHLLGAVLTVAFSSLAPFMPILLNPRLEPDRMFRSLIWIAPAVLLGNLLLSTRGLVIVIMALGLVLGLLPVFQPLVELSRYSFASGFIAAMSILTLVASRHRNLVEQDRLEELFAANRELNALQVALDQRVEDRTTELAGRTLELDNTKNFLNSIIDTLPSSLSVKDAQMFRYVYSNKAAEELIGLNHGEMLGKGDDELYPKELAERFNAEDRLIVSERKPLDIGEELVYTRSGGQRVLHTRKVLITNTDGSSRYILGISEDITRRKQAEAARERSEGLFQALFKYSPDAVILIDPYDPNISWPIIDCNAAACDMNGYTREELIGQSIDILNISVGTEAERTAYLQQLRAAGSLKLEAAHCHKNGMVFPIEVSTSIITVSGREWVLGIDRDITKRKQTEEALRRQNNYLAALHDTTIALLSGLELTALLEGILTRARHLLEIDYGFIYLLASNGEEMEFAVGIGLKDKEIKRRLLIGEGIVGSIWQGGQSLIIDNYDQWPGRVSTISAGRFGAILAAPLKWGDQINGVIGLGCDPVSEKFLGDPELEILTRFAQLASIALENARLLETERTARQQAETLQAATQTLSATLDLNKVLEIILTKLQEVVPYDSASVQEIREGELEIIGGIGFPNWDEVWGIGLKFDLNTEANPNREIIETRQPFILNDVTASRYTGFQDQIHAAAEIRSWMGVPLLFGDHVIGIVTLDNKVPNFYTHAHAQVALPFATQAAIAIRNARLYTAAQEYAAENAALYRAATQLLNPGTDLKGLARQVAEAVIHEFAFANCRVLLMDETGSELQRIADAGEFHVEGVAALPLTGSGLTITAARSGEMVYSPDVMADPHYLAGDMRTRSELVMPLKNQGRVIGVLDLQSPEPNAFDKRAQRIIAAFAKHAELTLENARLVTNLTQAYRRLQDDQEQLLAAEKMASLGRLTAGIAHEMNTPLAAARSGLAEINSLIAEYQAAIGDSDITLDDHRAIALDMQKAVRLANSSAERAASFVRSIKSQTRDSSPNERLRFKVVPVIKDTLLLLGHALRYGKCTATFEYDVEDPELMGSPGRLAQVITNLMTNAIDANVAKGGGAIQVQMTRTTSGFDLRVSDSGTGIPPELITKIFDPMFTTKPFGQGTGLGLTIIHDIVTGDFGGTIEVSSQISHGTLFTIHFPTFQEA
jgi:PAS domain S-box-containing protein